MGRRNLPCSTVKAQTENSTGAFLASSSRASSSVSESLPPESATATRSPSRIILKRPTASPTLRNSIFSRSKFNGSESEPRRLDGQHLQCGLQFTFGVQITSAGRGLDPVLIHRASVVNAAEL